MKISFTTSANVVFGIIGKALVDKCFCPERTVKQWLSDFKCPSSYKQIDDSLALYKTKGIKLSQLPVRLANEFSDTHGIYYSIVNNKVRTLFISVHVHVYF